MADTNLTTSDNLVALSIDFVNSFSNSVQGLLNVLQGVRPIPMASGVSIKTYKTTVTKATQRTVGEGEEIPLTKVSRKLDKTYTLNFTDKIRKATPMEAIYVAGATQAIHDTDAEILNIAQNNAKSDLFNALSSKATTKITSAGFQQAVADALGKLTVVAESKQGGGQTVVFVNPIDLYSWLGNQQITVQSDFGLQYIKNFLNANTVIMSGDVTQGHVYATYVNNIKFYYLNLNSEPGSLMGYTTDPTGLIGIKHYRTDTSDSYDTNVVGGWLVIPEYTDFIVDSDFSAAPKAAGSGLGK